MKCRKKNKYNFRGQSFYVNKQVAWCWEENNLTVVNWFANRTLSCKAKMAVQSQRFQRYKVPLVQSGLGVCTVTLLNKN